MLNQISVMGRIVRDPELRRTNSGKPVTSFTLACDRDFKNSQTGEKEVDFLDCVAWNSTAEIVEKYFHKGQMAVASGRLQIRQYTDKNGQKRRQAEILASSVYSVEARKAALRAAPGGDSGYNASASMANEPGNDFAQLEDEDAQLPF